MAIEVRMASPCEASWASMQGDARSTMGRISTIRVTRGVDE
jgi:hypothetical protein